MTRLPAHAYLDERGVAYETRTFSQDIDKGAASVAQALGFNERQMVKSLIFETGDEEYVLVLLPGDRSAKSGLLKKALGTRNVRMASSDVVKRVTGYEVGSIPPFHWQPQGFRTFIEASLMQETHLGVGAGVWGHEIILSPSGLLEATHAQVVKLVPDA